MSLHSSLRASSVSARHRNVLKRFERIQKLEADERWQPGMSVFGLPKVKSIKVKVKKVKAEKAAVTGEAAPAAGAVPAVAPAKGAGKGKA